MKLEVKIKLLFCLLVLLPAVFYSYAYGATESLDKCKSLLIRVMVFKIAAAVQDIYFDKKDAWIKSPTYKPTYFLPPDDCFQSKRISPQKAIEFFYSAVMLSDVGLIKRMYSNLSLYLRNQEDKSFFAGLHKLALDALDKKNKKTTENRIDAEVAAFYFLLTGDFITRIQIKKQQEKRLKKVMTDFIKNIYHTKVIETNPDTLRDKIYLWLGARNALNSGDYNLAYACLKSTFAYDLLDRFGPDNQVYFYATLQLAVKIGSYRHLGYVYTGLKRLTGHMEQSEVGELIDTVNRIRYQEIKRR